jgi:hypothetical protein
MITYLRTMALLMFASVWVNHSRATGLDITREDWSTVAPEVRSGEQADFPNRSASVGQAIDFENETEEARREPVDALKSYRILAESDPETNTKLLMLMLASKDFILDAKPRAQNAVATFELGLLLRSDVRLGDWRSRGPTVRLPSLPRPGSRSQRHAILLRYIPKSIQIQRGSSI